jgi:serine protease Do
MKQTWKKFFAFAFAVALLVPASLLAQDEKEKEVKETKENKEAKEAKEAKEKKDVRQIIVTARGDKDEKIVVEVVGDKVTVNGKPLEEYKDKNGDINVRLNKLKDLESLTIARGLKDGLRSYSSGDGYTLFSQDANQAMLGVTTEKIENGVKIQDITKESGAEKAGLKEGDVITKIDDKKIEDPDDLSKVIKSHKPGDKVTVNYLRDKKEQKVTAELTKWKGQDYNFKMDMGNMNFDKMMPKIKTPGVIAPYGQTWSWSGGSPKLGLSVQDTDDGKGVKVIEVDDESNAAKAGVKENDVITEVDGKAVNGTDEMVKIIKESKDKASLMIKLQRSGKTQNIEVKMPHKIKTADL